MTPKMRKFCEEYLTNGGHGANAAEAAGYTGTNQSLRNRANLLLKQDEIKELMAGHAKKACNKTQLTVQSILADLEWSKTTARVGYATAHGIRSDLAAFNRAVELQGKYLKMWVDKMELTGDGHTALMEIIKKRLNNGA